MAVMVTLWSAVMAVVVALKVAEVDAAAIVTDPGTASAALLSESPTVAPPAGAALVRVTVQVLEEFGPRLVGVHAREETSTDAARFMVVLAELPL